MWFSISVLLCVLALTAADTPANCTYAEIKGTWIFQETGRTGDSSIDCENNADAAVNIVRISLSQFDTAVDEFGNVGTWTLIYNQGFEITVNERTYFAFSKYEVTGGEVINYCDQTLYGWSHDVTSRNWACFSGSKVDKAEPKVTKVERKNVLSGHYKGSDEYINKINAAQKSWTAKKYQRFEGMTHEEIINMQGGRGSILPSRPSPAPIKRQLRDTPFPKEFDWRNVDGVNYVPDVRDQASCGSCYIFASVGMMESRIRVQTNNTERPLLSPQHVLSCSPYAQGCSGGFPYLTAGKYSFDYGLVAEECMPYEAKDLECIQSACARHYIADYSYVGGYYGACNEAEMKKNLLENGPLAVGFMVYSDFKSYSGGVYHYTGLEDQFNPFEITNHAVLVVGYGTDEATGEDYWSVMNSWGEEWGDKGYFKIRRGTDECGIESIAVTATPIP